MKSKYDSIRTYVLLDRLAPCPIATKEKVAVVIDGVLGSNHAVNGQWPLEAPFYLRDLDGEDLQGRPDVAPGSAPRFPLMS